MPSRSPDRRLAARLALGLLLLVASASTALASGFAVQVANGPRNAKVIALTFDDGSSPDNCRRILAELVAAGVPATFFPIAKAMQLDPAFWRLVAEVGDPIGDHTLTHPQMPTLSYAAQVDQMSASRAIVETIIGRPMLNVFRPPYGAWDATTLRAAATTGFPTVITWDTSDRDTSPQGALKDMLAAAERGTNGSVILMHCGPNATPYLVPSVIDHYRSLGFRFVTVPALLGLSWSPGTVGTVAPATILGSLTPLPAAPKGGPIPGGAGWTGPIPTPSPIASPGATSSASPTPRGLADPSSEAVVTSSAAPRPTGAVPAGSIATAGGDTAPVLVAGIVVVVGAAVIVLLGAFEAARRRRRDT